MRGGCSHMRWLEVGNAAKRAGVVFVCEKQALESR
jgi:hypothetical protein